MSTETFPHPPPPVNLNTHPDPFNLNQWIMDNCKSEGIFPLYSPECEFKVLIIKGTISNSLNIFIKLNSEVFFHVLSGKISINSFNENNNANAAIPSFQNIVLNKGDNFLLTNNLYHNYQSTSDSLIILVCRDFQHKNFLNAKLNDPTFKTNKNDFFAVICNSCQKNFIQKDQILDHSSDPNNFHLAFHNVLTNLFQNKNKYNNCSNCSNHNLTELNANDWNKKVNELKSSSDLSNFKNEIYNPTAVNFPEWIINNTKFLQPPVCNKLMYDNDKFDLKIQVVGGPNVRTDYHIEEGEEWFWQIKGSMCVKIMDRDNSNQLKERDIWIHEGQSFLLPAKTPHSPQRFKDTIGLVIERIRLPTEVDCLRYYCPNKDCRKIIHTFSFHCQNLGTQLKEVIGLWYDEKSKEMRKCKSCGSYDEKPTPKN